RHRDRAQDGGVRAAVDQGAADVRAPVRRSGGSRRALEARRAVRRALSDRGLHRRAARGRRKAASEIPRKVSVRSTALRTGGARRILATPEYKISTTPVCNRRWPWRVSKARDNIDEAAMDWRDVNPSGTSVRRP